jgi:hypothetical protein
MVRPYAIIEEPLIRYRVHDSQAIGVPERPVLDDTWSRWKARVKHAAKIGTTDVSRQTRRLQAQMFRGAVERYRTAGHAYLEGAGRTPQPLTDATIAQLEERAEHLRIRGTLPDRRLARFGVILDEVRTGRYRRFSAGIFSGLQDLIY